MAIRHEIRKGFMRFQRLGPIEFGDQKRWSIRAPESTGLWAFPYPHFDEFYAYHRYVDLLPKKYRERMPKDPSWYTEDHAELIPARAIKFMPLRGSMFSEPYPHYRTAEGEWEPATLRSAYHEEREAWIENVGKKILPLREFWYRGDIYTHFTHQGTVGEWTMSAQEEGNEFTLMSTNEFERHMRRNGVKGSDGTHDGAGKPLPFNFSKDHLEVFIPRGRGIIRNKPE